jgi:hypothetical protein
MHLADGVGPVPSICENIGEGSNVRLETRHTGVLVFYHMLSARQRDPVRPNAVAPGIEAREQRSPRGHADRIRREVPGVSAPLSRNLVDIRRIGVVIVVAAQGVEPLLIGMEDNEIHKRLQCSS